jgi:hypothetical protein
MRQRHRERQVVMLPLSPCPKLLMPLLRLLHPHLRMEKSSCSDVIARICKIRPDSLNRKETVTPLRNKIPLKIKEFSWT